MTQSIRKLAIVGASARAAAFSAIRAGYDVVAADLFADADLQHAANATRIKRYPDGLIDWIETVDADAWMYSGALENYSNHVSLMAAMQPLLGNDSTQLKRARDPMTLQRAVRSAGLSFPETRSTADRLPLDGSWLCKTYRGSSGSGVWRLDGVAAQQRAEHERAVFQRLIHGMAAAVAFVIGDEGPWLLGLTQQLIGDGTDHPWRYVGSVGPLSRQAELEEQWASLGDLLCQRFELRGLVGVDLVLADGRAWVVEINPRYTASMEILERATGISSVAVHVAACDPDGAGRTVADALANPSRAPSGRVHAKSILFAPRDATVTPEFFEWAMGQSSLDAERCFLADIPHAGETIPRGRPVLTALASGASAAECQSQLHQRLAEVRARLYDG